MIFLLLHSHTKIDLKTEYTDNDTTATMAACNEREQQSVDFGLALPRECMTLIFSFVGGNINKDSLYNCSKAGKFYRHLALVSRSWKRAIDFSLPSLVINLKVVLEGRQLECTDSLLLWLEKFRLPISSIKVPNLFLKERNALMKILHTFDVDDLVELSLGKSEWHDTWGAPLYLGKLESRAMGDAFLQELIASKCRNLLRLDIALDMNGLEMHKPSDDLFSMKSIKSLSLTPVYSCYSDGQSVFDLAFVTRLVKSLPALENLELRGSCLQHAPESKLPLVSSSLKTLHGYSFPNHVWINVDRCPNLHPYL